MTPDILIGDVRDRLAELPEGHFHTCVTSPPYWGLRDYGGWTAVVLWGAMDDFTMPRKHKDRWLIRIRWRAFERGHVSSPNGQSVFCAYGLEPTPEMFLEHTVEVFRAVRRVLRDDGTCWVNLGDSYCSHKPRGGASHTQSDDIGDQFQAFAAAKKSVDLRGKHPVIKDKDLIGIPWRVALALQADGWYLRSDIIWAKPNPMPESCTDRPTKSHEYIFLLTKKPRYYYDLEAVREPFKGNGECSVVERQGGTRFDDSGKPVGAIRTYDRLCGANARDVWTIPTQPYPEAHFATYPEELPARCIRAGTSERGCCPECGAGWVRVVDVSYTNAGNGNNNMKRKGAEFGPSLAARPYETRKLRTSTTLEWRPGCECYERANGIGPNECGDPCRVLDPFLGSGTTLAVAAKLGRTGIGIELNPEYAKLAERRIGRAVRGESYRDPDLVEDAPLFVTA